MGACPKHRGSRMRKYHRRMHDKLPPLALAKCNNCFEVKLAHRVCPACGHYGKNVEVFEVAKA